VSYSDVVWLPNALIFTALLGALAVWRWKAKGPLVGLRWTGVAMLPLALYGIGLFQLAWRVGLAFSHFLTGFVWRPSVWFGLLLLAVAVLLIVVPGKINGRVEGGSSPKAVTAKKRAPAGTSGDDDMSEIEDILRKHGIG
jgi:hypothetical protein